MIKVFIDNMVWDFLFERKLDLCAELPSDEFSLWITRQGEFEIRGLPPDKKAFTEATILRCSVQTDWVFGFLEVDDEGNALSEEQQKNAGYEQGRLWTEQEAAISNQQRWRKPNKKRPSGLNADEADLELAARSLHSVILSGDARRGPISARRE